ncbi:MAG: phosphomannomutase/phosphoglucomutase [Alphaproteobacteria bacterium]|nr:phosphomannomutase/phosphoglucomutase [Alphaproteobacteria bacterium]
MTQRHTFHPTVLREYDVRGIVGETLGEADAYAIGRSFPAMLDNGGARIGVGFDGRLSSPALEGALVRGLSDAGVTAVRVGRGPTPMLYFAVHTMDLDGGIMVTGSHNPPTHNGFKMMRGKKAFYGADISALGDVAKSGGYRTGIGRNEQVTVAAAYVAKLRATVQGSRPLTVAWDPGNGAAGDILAALLHDLPGRHIVINGTIDGRFPAHHPDPTVPENLVELQTTVAAYRCDLGIAFDGDGDRIGVVDGQGRILWGDQLLALFAGDVLTRHPGATIIADVKASQTLFDEVARLGGRPLMWKCGHSLIKSKMAKVGSPLAGEMSGHIFFADGYFGFDDALYAAVRLVDLLARGDRSLAAFKDALPAAINTPEMRFACAEERKFTVIDEVRDRLQRQGARVDAIDGVRVSTADGWWLLRASNTQAVLVARCESSSESGLTRLKIDLSGELRRSGIEPPPM